MTASDPDLTPEDAAAFRRAVDTLATQLIPNLTFVADVTMEHGKPYTYKKHGCRCGPCREAAAEAKADYYRRRRDTEGDDRPNMMTGKIRCVICDRPLAQHTDLLRSCYHPGRLRR